MSFSENLQFLRAQAGVTQEQLAEQLDVSRQSVSKWEGGLSFPEMDTLLRICDLYSVNLDTLLRSSMEESRTADTAKYDAFMTRFAGRISLAMAAIIAGAVWSFVYGGILHDKYDVARYNRENDPASEVKRRSDLIGTVCGVIMLLATAVYAGLGLSLDLWGTAWWVFAVGGILCAVAAVALSPQEE